MGRYVGYEAECFLLGPLLLAREDESLRVLGCFRRSRALCIERLNE